MLRGRASLVPVGRRARDVLVHGSMPYASNAELPIGVRKNLPRHAQDIYRAAFNTAFERYGATREAVAHRIAWAAVKRSYLHASAGVWVRRVARDHATRASAPPRRPHD